MFVFASGLVSQQAIRADWAAKIRPFSWDQKKKGYPPSFTAQRSSTAGAADDNSYNNNNNINNTNNISQVRLASSS